MEVTEKMYKTGKVLIRAYFAAVVKSGCQSQESSRIKLETTGSPMTLCPIIHNDNELDQEQVTNSTGVLNILISY